MSKLKEYFNRIVTTRIPSYAMLTLGYVASSHWVAGGQRDCALGKGCQEARAMPRAVAQGGGPHEAIMDQRRGAMRHCVRSLNHIARAILFQSPVTSLVSLDVSEILAHRPTVTPTGEIMLYLRWGVVRSWHTSMRMPSSQCTPSYAQPARSHACSGRVLCARFGKAYWTSWRVASSPRVTSFVNGVLWLRR